jgi:uncharacterized membrane protein YfcA
MNAHDLWLTVAAFLSETLGTVSGFGSSTFFVPAAVLFESFQMVLALTALLHVFGNISKLAQFRAKAPRSLLLRLAVPAIVLTGLGALLTRFVPVEYFKIALGIALVFIPLARWALKMGDHHLPRSWSTAMIGLSGFLTGLVGTGGALRGLVLASFRLDKATFVVLSAAIDLGGDILRAAIYLGQGYFPWDHWFYLPLLGLAGWCGALVGRQILIRIPQRKFEFLVQIFVLVSGCALLWEALLMQPR